jgi:DNA-binding MarR family transcriptional regulator
LAVVHARLLAGADKGARRGGGGGGLLVELLNPLVAMVVQPYLGLAAAERELARPVGARRAVRRGPVVDPLEGLDMRLTYRTLRVLAAIAAAPGASNRTVAQAAGVADQGQISKLLARLEGLGLICNRSVGHLKGEANAWELTVRGMEVEQAVRARSAITNNEGT